jgi:hypothetical protein
LRLFRWLEVEKSGKKDHMKWRAEFELHNTSSSFKWLKQRATRVGKCVEQALNTSWTSGADVAPNNSVYFW